VKKLSHHAPRCFTDPEFVCARPANLTPMSAWHVLRYAGTLATLLLPGCGIDVRTLFRPTL